MNEATPLHQQQEQSPPAEQPCPEQVLFHHPPPAAFTDKYIITGELGSGGFGFVVTAIDSSRREWAVKFIYKDRISAENWCQDKLLGRVPLEIHILSRMHHPSIIGMVDYYENDAFCILVTELHGAAWKDEVVCDAIDSIDGSTQLLSMTDRVSSIVIAASSPFGSSKLQFNQQLPFHLPTPSADCMIPEPLIRRSSMDLFECIEQCDHLTEPQAAYVFKQVVDGVRFMHSKNVVHRDIKDENIVIDDQFRVKIIDFGSAAVDVGTPYRTFRGTIQYAAPEILRGEKYHGRPCDIWALGILLYIILYGEVPFSSGDQAISESPRAPRFQTSAECQHLIYWMLQKKSTRRPTIEQVFYHPWLLRVPTRTSSL
ncbi:hypothetical protein SmJEL517_g00524 [Synchytrium microbalum]|uniref:Protein kinase domain-containing protein n=1 Tax=Synchytrium microbalum TaxID=1806994 RepID=A0A507CDD7_9FUNG|nr:uncharacterized protein SmJEL517_g00524 [Synchytrium microbalum]TPX37511.1 hypothetical protein SmJEL517_g00524 [Synchytrium microbalum]